MYCVSRTVVAVTSNSLKFIETHFDELCCVALSRRLA